MQALLTKVAPSITDMIRADHSRVLATFHRYKTGTGAGTKQALVASICLALEVHAQAEEEIFYPAMGSIDPATVGKLIPEHDRMRNLIGALRGMDAGAPEYDSTVMELMRDVLRHVADEETKLLPDAERVLGERRLAELGVQMTRRRMELAAPHIRDLAVGNARTFPGVALAFTGLLAVGGLLAARALARPWNGVQRLARPGRRLRALAG